MSKIEDIKFYKSICNFCHPNYWQQIGEECQFKNRNCPTQKEYEKHRQIEQKHYEEKSVNCIELDDESGDFVCKKHLLEIANLMPEN